MKNKKYNRGGYKSKTDWGAIKIVLMVASFGALLIVGLGGSFFFGEFEVKYAEAQVVPEQSVMEYIIKETRAAGMNVDDVIKVLAYESHFDPEFTLRNNDKVKSIDRGIWAINNYWHKEVSYACAYNVECSTREAIRIWKAEGWEPWLGAKKLGIK